MTATILITRPREDGRLLSHILTAHGFNCLLEPMMTILPCPLPDIPPHAGLIVTSKHAIFALSRHYTQFDTPLFVVGDATAASARDAGFTNIFTGPGEAESLASLIPSNQPGPLLYLSGKDIAFPIEETLLARGITCERIIVYNALATDHFSPSSRNALVSKFCNAVTFFSKRSAEIFLHHLSAADLMDVPLGLDAFCLSQGVAGTLDAANWQSIHVTTSPTQEALVEALITRYKSTYDGKHN